MLVLHYTGMETARAALARLCDPGALVSAHYVIDEDGTIVQLVAEARRAWHAGVSSWAGESDVNGLSIGIELVNPGHEFGYRPFSEPQMDALELLAGDILERRAIPACNVVGHSDVAPGRKEDPGELFDWERLGRSGIGLWPRVRPSRAPAPPLRLNDSGTRVAQAQAALAAYGYGLETTGTFNDKTKAVVTAFQRHFRPTFIDGVYDSDTALRLAALLRLAT